MKYFFNLCLIVSFLQGCVNNIKTSLPTYNEITSSVLILEEDTMLVYITDFFSYHGESGLYYFFFSFYYTWC